MEEGNKKEEKKQEEDDDIAEVPVEKEEEDDDIVEVPVTKTLDELYGPDNIIPSVVRPLRPQLNEAKVVVRRIDPTFFLARNDKMMRQAFMYSRTISGLKRVKQEAGAEAEDVKPGCSRDLLGDSTAGGSGSGGGDAAVAGPSSSSGCRQSARILRKRKLQEDADCSSICGMHMAGPGFHTRRSYFPDFRRGRRSLNGLTAEEVEALGKMEMRKEAEERKIRQPKENKVKLVKTTGEMFQGILSPIAIFPEEVWDVILTRVSTVDRLAVCRTNTELDSAFGEFKSQWLFDQVLPHLMKHFTQKKQLLKCREVCKTWRRYVDTLLESGHPCRRHYMKDHPMEQVICRMPTVYGSLRKCGLEYLQFTPISLQKFINCPKPSGPLVGRAISFQISGLWDEPDIDEFWAQARAFLEAQGGTLWHFKFVQYNMHLTTQRFYLMLWECLNLLPNLKTLEIRCHLDKVHFSMDREIVPVINANPPPVHDNLTSIDIEGLPRVMQEHFITQFNAQLKRFSLDMDIHSEMDIPKHLIELCVKRISSEEVLRKLYSISMVPSLCHKLTLDMSLCTRVQGSVLLEVLNKYPKLAHLRLILLSRTSYVCQGSFSHKGYQAPSVEYFEIEGDGRDLFYFSTLLYAFPNLNYLHIRDTSYPGHDGSRTVRKYITRDDVKVEIEQYLYANKVEESPIWDTLDDLQVLTFESVNGTFKRFCTREQVNHYRENNMEQTDTEAEKNTEASQSQAI